MDVPKIKTLLSGRAEPKLLPSTSQLRGGDLTIKEGNSPSSTFFSKVKATVGNNAAKSQNIEDAIVSDIVTPANQYTDLLKSNLDLGRTKKLLRGIEKPEDKRKVRKLILSQLGDYLGPEGTLVKGDFDKLFRTQSYLKKGKYDKSIVGQWKKEVDKALGEDFRDSMISIADKVLPENKLRDINKRYQAISILSPGIEKGAKGEQVKQLSDVLMFKPTGNPLANSMITGGVAASSLLAPQTIPLFLAAKLLGTRKGQMLGAQGIEKLGQGMQFAGKTPASELTRALLSIKNSGE